MIGWKYHTNISPQKIICSNDPLTIAFDTFFREIIIEEDQIYEKEHHKIYINTLGENNNVIISLNGKKYIFYKDRFISSRKFKQKMIDFYNSKGFFVRNPKELVLNNGHSTKQWIIELSKIK